MSDSSVQITMTAKDDKALATFQKTKDAAAALGAATEAAGKKSSDAYIQMRREASAAAATIRQMEKEATALTRNSRSPMERFTEDVAKLGDKFQTGMIDVRAYSHEMEILKKRLADESGETVKLAKAESERQQSLAQGIAIMRRHETAQERYARDVAEVTRLHKVGAIDAKFFGLELASLQKRLDDETGVTELANKEQSQRNALMERGRQITQSLMSAEEQRTAALREAAALRKNGDLTPETFNRRVSQINTKYANDSGELARSNEERARRNRLEQEALSLTEKHQTSQQRLASRLAELEKLKATGQLSQRALNRETAIAIQHQVEGSRLANAWKDGLSQAGNAVTMLGAGLMAALHTELQMVEGARNVTLELDKQARRYAVLEGLKNPKEISQNVLKIALQNGMKSGLVNSLSQQLSSAGFADPIQGGATDVAAKAAAAGSLDDSEVASYAEGASMYMEAYGMEKNASNLLDISVRMAALGNKTQARMSDIGAFGTEASAMQVAGVSSEDTLSMMALLRQTRSAGQSATGARNIVNFLTTMAGKKPEEEALGELGLTPEDVDLSGEDIKDVLKLLNEKISAQPAARQGVIREKLFGRENSSAAAVLIRDWEKISELNESQKDKSAFEHGVKTNQSSGEAAANRIEVQGQMDAQMRSGQLLKDKAISDAMKLQAQRKIEDSRRSVEEEFKKWRDKGSPLFTEDRGIVGAVADSLIERGAVYVNRSMQQTAEMFGASPESLADSEAMGIAQGASGSGFNMAEYTAQMAQMQAAVAAGVREGMQQSKPVGPQQVEVVNQPEPKPQPARPPVPVPSTRLGSSR